MLPSTHNIEASDRSQFALPSGRIDFGRAICSDPAAASRREWLVANGIGGYACGTISGELTRRYHGLLVAALNPPVGRYLLVTKFEETASYLGQRYALTTDRWEGGRSEPQGFRYLERFNLDGTVPVWQYACGDALLEKRIWMQAGANTTYIQYILLRGIQALDLDIQLLCNYRDYHGVTRGEKRLVVEAVGRGLRVAAGKETTPYYLLCTDGNFSSGGRWVGVYSLAVEQYRGFDGLEDHFLAGMFNTKLLPGCSVTLVATLDPDANLDGVIAHSDRKAHEQGLVKIFWGTRKPSDHISPGSEAANLLERLCLAADQFIVSRRTGPDDTGHSVIAGYPWFGDWGRDTMISLPGLALSTGRYEIAASILRTYARFVDRGMLPNRFPDEGQAPEYNTVDATLWYFEAIRAYIYATRQDEDLYSSGNQLLAELFPVLEEIIEWHLRGTRYQIHVDPIDGLIYAGEPGVQLTWMDAKVAGWVVTPRIGKPVEINALWYNALMCMTDFTRLLGYSSQRYGKLAQQVKTAFQRFWYTQGGFCYDVVDGPEGDDNSLRPNQLLAVSLPYSSLRTEQWKPVVDACSQHLLTSHGLRSLAPFEPDYQGHYGGDVRKRDAAYHQGTVWSWLISPFVRAHLRVYHDRQAALSFILPLLHHLSDHGLGSVSEIFDGDPPFTPRGCFAQAWGVSELLRAFLDIQSGDVFPEGVEK